MSDSTPEGLKFTYHPKGLRFTYYPKGLTATFPGHDRAMRVKSVTYEVEVCAEANVECPCLGDVDESGAHSLHFDGREEGTTVSFGPEKQGDQE